MYKLRPNTPKQVFSSGASRVPACRLRPDIGDLLWDLLLLPPALPRGETDLDRDLEYLLEYLGDLDRDLE